MRKKLIVCFALIAIGIAPAYAEENTKKRTFDTSFIVFSAAVVGATVFDVETTFRGIGRCEGNCVEGNALMRPFVESGRPATYALTMGINAASLYAAYRMKKSGSRYWFLLPTAAITSHSVAGSLNLRF